MSDELIEELNRICSRPSAAQAPIFATLDIEVLGNVEDYGRKLREIVRAALGVAHDEGFENDVVDSSGVPAWFAQISDDARGGEPVSREVLEIRERYRRERDGDAWDMQEWLFAFDPDLRRWRWWDLTAVGSTRVILWVDTKGEPVIPCEELWWAVFAAGARSARGISLASSDEWQRQASVGIC